MDGDVQFRFVCNAYSDFSPLFNTTSSDFNYCFRQILLTLPIFALFALISVYNIGKMRYVNYNAQWNKCQSFIIYFRVILVGLLGILPVLHLTVITILDQLNELLISLAFVKTLSWLIHLSSILMLKRGCRYNTRGSPAIIFIWFLTALSSTCDFRSQFINTDQIIGTNIQLSNLIISGFECFLQGFYLLTLIPGKGGHLSEEQFKSLYHLINGQADEIRESHLDDEGVYLTRFNDEDHEPLTLGVAKEDSGYFSKLFFHWVNPLLRKGACGFLRNPNDVFELPPYLSTSRISSIMQSNSSPSGSTNPKSTISVLHSSFGIQFYSIGILKFLADAFGFMGPIFLNLLVTFIEDEDVSSNKSQFYGYYIVAGLFLSSAFGALSNIHFNMCQAEMNLKLRAALVTSIFKKTIRLKKTKHEKFSSGEILNFMSVDTDRFVNICPSFHALWSLPIQILITLYLLYLQIGISFLAGLSFTILLIPINRVIANKIGDLSGKMMKFKDDRVKLMSEILYGIKIIKFHNWEGFFIDKVEDVRKKELKSLKGRKYLDALCVYFWACTPVLVSLLSFGTFILLGNDLTAAKVFTSLALFNMLIAPLNAIPWVINGFVEALVSYKRIATLLHTKEDESDFQIAKEEEVAISLKNASFDWDKDHNGFNLEGINLTVKKGEMIGIYGSIGTGKTSLFLSLLDELNKSEGIVSICDNNGFGIVLQEPFIQLGTIRMNILFGRPFKARLYDEVLRASCLDEDLKEMENSDKTLIGESGSTLSGGQKARLSLARSLYQEKDIYLIDDIYSAVDLKVAKEIHKRCIMGYLASKTRLISTHHLNFLQSANKLLVLENGKIIKEGEPKTLFPDAEVELEHEDSNLEEDKNILSPYSQEKRVRCNSRMSDYEKDDKREMNDELLEKGSIDASIYKRYFGSVGSFLSILILISFIAMQSSRNISDLWLSHWISATSNSNGTSNHSNYGHTYQMQGLVEYIGQRLPIIHNLDPNTQYYMTVFILIGVSNTFFTLIRAFLFAYGGIQAAYKLHDSLISSVLKARMNFFDLNPVGRIFNRFSSDVSTADDSLPFIMNILLAQAFGLLGTLILISYSMPLFIILVIPLLLICNNVQRYYRVTARQLRRISSISQSPIYAHFAETLKGLVTIRAFRSIDRFEYENEIHLEANQKCQFCTQALSNWLNLRLQIVGICIITGVGLIGIIQHQMSQALPAIIGLSLSLTLTVTANLNGFITFLVETEKEMVAVERISDYIDNIEEESQTESLIAIPFGWPLQGVVSFQNVSFKYREELPYVLKNVTFETRPSEKIGIVGRTGAGKSSLFQILFRMVDSFEGNIIIDSLNTKHLSLNQLRSRLCIIPQDPTIFSGTLRSNLDPRGIYSHQEIVRAMERCNLSGKIRCLDSDEYVSSLSTGQKQLVCLCRAILTSAKIILIDEATSNVDMETDQLIQATILNAFRQNTVLTIAHRVTTILQYDRILVMRNGEIVEFDTPDNLRADKNSYFYSLSQGVKAP